MTAEFLSRLQFAFTISFHILFPAFSIGLITFISIIEGIYLKTKNIRFLNMAKFWTKILALTFGMGIVSGIVMEFQLGTNWAGFANVVGSVLGSLFTYEVLTAFFIEAGFLGVMFFGWNKVGPKLHYTATLLVWLGVSISAFWILSANSWMQNPTGARLEMGRFVTDSWAEVIFNPILIPRFLHMLLAAYISTFFVVAGISAYYLLSNRHIQFAKTCFSIAMLMLLIMVPMQWLVGDKVGLNVHEYQPLKTAAMEGVWETQEGAPLLLFAIPVQSEAKNYYEVKIPHLASLLNTHQWNGKLVGLKTVQPEDRPYVFIVFWSFRIMVGLGLLMGLIVLTGLWLRLTKRLHTARWFLKVCVAITPIGFISFMTGWFTAEVGRQPWIVYNLLRTADAGSPITVWHVLASFILLIIVYGVIFGYFYFKYLFKTIAAGPSAEDEPDPTDVAFPFMAQEDLVPDIDSSNKQ